MVASDAQCHIRHPRQITAAKGINPKAGKVFAIGCLESFECEIGIAVADGEASEQLLSQIGIQSDAYRTGSNCKIKAKQVIQMR